MMTPSMDLAFGVWTPEKIIYEAKKYMAMTAAPVERILIGNRLESAQAGLGMNLDARGATLIMGILAVAVALRVGASWYIGKQIGRPVSGALIGGVFGAPGLGVLSLFPSNARPNKRTQRKSQRGRRRRRLLIQ